jgi:hypothetical protein
MRIAVMVSGTWGAGTYVAPNGNATGSLSSDYYAWLIQVPLVTALTKPTMTPLVSSWHLPTTTC